MTKLQDWIVEESSNHYVTQLGDNPKLSHSEALQNATSMAAGDLFQSQSLNHNTVFRNQLQQEIGSLSTSFNGKTIKELRAQDKEIKEAVNLQRKRPSSSVHDQDAHRPIALFGSNAVTPIITPASRGASLIATGLQKNTRWHRNGLSDVSNRRQSASPICLDLDNDVTGEKTEDNSEAFKDSICNILIDKMFVDNGYGKVLQKLAEGEKGMNLIVQTSHQQKKTAEDTVERLLKLHRINSQK